MVHIAELSEFCGAKDKLSSYQLRHTAELITAEFGFLSLAEFMLFARRFKSGNYGRFYGRIDPVLIMQTIRQFLTERNDAYAEHESRLEEKRIHKMLNNPNNMDWDTWDFLSSTTREYEMLTPEQDKAIELKRKQNGKSS